jgi:hypothetical protein
MPWWGKNYRGMSDGELQLMAAIRYQRQEAV